MVNAGCVRDAAFPESSAIVAALARVLGGLALEAEVVAVLRVRMLIRAALKAISAIGIGTASRR
jgi:hypothetical protein